MGAKQSEAESLVTSKRQDSCEMRTVGTEESILAGTEDGQTPAPPLIRTTGTQPLPSLNSKFM